MSHSTVIYQPKNTLELVSINGTLVSEKEKQLITVEKPTELTLTRKAQVLEVCTFSNSSNAENILSQQGFALAYDGSGRLTSITYDSGAEKTFTYNTEGQLETITSGSTVKNLSYDDNGRLETVSFS